MRMRMKGCALLGYINRGWEEKSVFPFDYYVARPNFIIVNSSIVRTSITVLPLPH